MPMMWIFKPGFLIPKIAKMRIPVNRDGSPFDHEAFDEECSNAPFYVEAHCIEWLGVGMPLRFLGPVKPTQNPLDRGL